MLLGGEPIGERFIEWNFVSSSKDRIEQAKADWRAGRMKLPDLDHDEFIPLPGKLRASARRETVARHVGGRAFAAVRSENCYCLCMNISLRRT